MADTHPPQRLKVGEVAAATGVSVRTLHHYEPIGLLRASGRTPAGHRTYLPKDVERLHRIVALRQLGFPLERIAALLDGPQAEPPATTPARSPRRSSPS